MMLSLLFVCVCVFMCACDCVHERVLWLQLGLLPFSFRHRKITKIFYALSVTIFYYLSFLQQGIATGHIAINFYVIQPVFW